MLQNARSLHSIKIIVLSLLTSILLGILGIIGIFSMVANASNETGDINESGITQPVAYLPLIASNRPCDIGGQTVVNGYPIQDITVLLSAQFFDSLPSVVMTATTNVDGNFCFSDVPPLSSCRGLWYGLGIQQPIITSSESFVSSWSLSTLHRCEEDQTYRDISIELADFEIITPTENLTVSLPIQFDWKRLVESEYYTLFWTQASCQYTTRWYTNTSSIEIAEVPDCFDINQPIYWRIRGRRQYKNGSETVDSHKHIFFLQP